MLAWDAQLAVGCTTRVGRTLLSDAFDFALDLDFDFDLARVGTDAFVRPPLTLILTFDLDFCP